jgi:hypothetical protein
MAFTDVWGPSRVTGINGERYYISFTDGATQCTIIYTMKKRTEVLGRMKDYDAYIFTQTGKHVKAFHCDNAKEYISKDVREYLGSRGIRLELTAPYSPQQNGVAERLNRTLIEHARAMLAARNIPLFLWPEAVAYATYLKNRSPTRALSDKMTPDEAFWGKKPNVAALQEFGTPCEVLIQDGKSSKLGVKTRSCIFVGLSDESRAWRYYNPNTRQVLTSRNIIFTDTITSDVAPPPLLKGENMLESVPETNPIEHKAPSTTPTQPAPASSASSLSTLTPISTPTHTSPAPRPKAPRDISSAITEDNIILGPRTRKYAHPDSAHLGYVLAAVADPIANDPLTVNEAKSRPDWPEWKKAMDAEMDQLRELGTFSHAPLPKDRTAVACK